MGPNPFSSGFRQELKLKEGYAQISGAGESGGTIKVWVEVHRPVIHVEANMKQPVSISSTYENWRTEDRILPNAGGKMGARSMCMITFDSYPGEIKVRKDTVEPLDNAVIFYQEQSLKLLRLGAPLLLVRDLVGLADQIEARHPMTLGLQFGGLAVELGRQHHRESTCNSHRRSRWGKPDSHKHLYQWLELLEAGTAVVRP